MGKIKKYSLPEIQGATRGLINLRYQYRKDLDDPLISESKTPLKEKKFQAIDKVLTALGAQRPKERMYGLMASYPFDESSIKEKNFPDAYLEVKNALQDPQVVAGVFSDIKKALERLADSLSICAIDAKIAEYTKRINQKEEFEFLRRSGFFSQPDYKKASVKKAACEKLKIYIEYYFDSIKPNKSTKPKPTALTADELNAVKEGTLNDWFNALPKTLQGQIERNAKPPEVMRSVSFRQE
ncbi:MAG: hypothetical protein ACD_42C00540G0003 [uncultured bacterium]|nr:MAG: hypothetical protein ACD_42C00540G0003 [uncultured bacterium]OGT33439.1 MAG: hypothetical protein A3C44_03690 [Gammaproteobacteria bacterium RIFCSPHIGHO2_02_FULL_39_13]OGT49475.1 MAG: hypothetical protein A3E53_02670 [Gammaproteobacteria bacterium RIFCSPHIGHO2_12_FULL_39_24]